MNVKRYETVIVGSGTGGATLARELSKRGKQVLVIERGKPETKIGTFQDSLRYFDATRITRMPRRSKEGVILWRTFMAGGSSVVSAGNATRCLEKGLTELGITLADEFVEAEQEMVITPVAPELRSEGSERIMWASKELGYMMEPMPKFVDPAKCTRCAKCVFGCKHDAKWTALNYLREAEQHGTNVLYETTVHQVIRQNGTVQGVSCTGPQGRTDILADVVVLAAGGLGTPVILQQAGIKEAGKRLFADLFVNTYGVTQGASLAHEPTMSLVDHEFHRDRGFILSPFASYHKMVRFMEAGIKGSALPSRGLLGIMAKTADDPAGRVYPDGTVSKPVTEADWIRLREGSEKAREILVKAGAAENSIVVSTPQGAHFGGTAAIGTVVDSDLQTDVDGLFVCDASVLPTAPGLPPILTIVALAKRLAKILAA